MAQELAYVRATQQPVTIDTINNVVTPLGSTLPTAQVTNAFPGRSENLLAVFQGQSYMLYLNASGAIQLAQLVSGTWTNISGFPGVAIPVNSGTLAPVALQVDRGNFIAVVTRSGSAGTDGTIIRVSTNGATWTAPLAEIPAPTQPTPSVGGNTIVWRNAVFIAHSAGITWASPTNSAVASGYDTGSDGGLASVNAPLGHFAFWNGNLYFALAGPVPAIYQLNASWTPTSPTSPPAWTLQNATGINSVNIFTPGPDTGTILLFVNKAGNLCIAYSGQLGSKLAVATPTGFPAFTDVTATYVPPAINTTPNLGFSLFVDDRRNTNELQTIVVRNSVANTMILVSWDGASPWTQRTTFTAVQFMLADERFGELRTYTEQQPAAFITAVAQVFPGRMGITYTIIDALSRPIDVFGEYSLTGDAWSEMTEGEGDSGNSQLASSPTGISYTWYWDAFVDIDGNLPFVFMRIVARISGV